MKTQHFADAIVSLIDNDHAIKRASKGDLAIIEGVLTGLVGQISTELVARDEQEWINDQSGFKIALDIIAVKCNTDDFSRKAFDVVSKMIQRYMPVERS